MSEICSSWALDCSAVGAEPGLSDSIKAALAAFFVFVYGHSLIAAMQQDSHTGHVVMRFA